MSRGYRCATRKMLDFAHHYGLTIATCMPADPASKGGSENAVKIAKADLVPCEANLLPEYDSFAELEAACAAFCQQVNNRPHRVTRRVPAEMLAEERARLHPLPEVDYRRRNISRRANVGSDDRPGNWKSRYMMAISIWVFSIHCSIRSGRTVPRHRIATISMMCSKATIIRQGMGIMSSRLHRTTIWRRVWVVITPYLWQQTWNCSLKNQTNSRLSPASNTWYFAEGSVGGSFNEFITLLNPSPTQAATVDITYLFQNKPAVTVQHIVNASTRFTASAGTDLKVPGNSPQEAISAIVQSSPVPVVAERPMYFTFHGIKSGTDVMGATNANNTLFYFAEGDSRQAGSMSYSTFVAYSTPALQKQLMCRSPITAMAAR